MAKNMDKRPLFSGYSTDEENPILEVLLSHRSIRKFKDKPIPQKALDHILTAAQQSSTSCNYQAYSIIVIDNLSIREQIRDLSGNQPYIADCGIFLIFCADISRLHYICKKQGYRFRGDHIDSLLSSHGDALIACQSAAVAAESMGFGICMIGNIRNEPQAISDLLELPQYVFATVGLAIGYPDEESDVKPRLPQRLVVSRNKYYANHLQEDIEAYDHVMCNSKIYHGRIQPLHEVDPSLKETFTEKNYGWIEHSARRLASCVQDQRRDFAIFLQRKGFYIK